MIKPDQIPDDVAIAASRAYWDGNQNWKGVISASINAWPGGRMTAESDWMRLGLRVILPLSQEKNDD